ncbi:E3 ubiquitin-protein ligase TRIM7-like isoform X1 [Agelaius phoeniceus]|uniref:E3 ubiquitin-protein ligase TRIM7-like isoform X1 n=1 Tax=Agelaius phoeniceus TaxID=39638 RepID=UPI004054B00A
MAEEVLALREQLVAEATCPLCLDVFEQPVLTACGHSFCGTCLADVLGDPPRPAACPQCRAPLEPGSQRPNRSLGNMAGLARALEEVAARPRCPQHGKALALFCEPCAALLCAPCRDGPEHRRHRVRPAEEAARELRETLQRNLLFLQKQKEKLKSTGDGKIEDLQVTVRSELQRVTESFEELQQCLEEQKKALLGQLEQMSQELVNKSEEYTSRVLERQSLLDTVIAQIQEKRDQPGVEFLQETLQRNLLFLQKQKEKLKSTGDQKIEDLQVTVMWELQRVTESFEELQQCLEEQKKALLGQLEQMSQELVNKSEEYTSRVLERQSLLDTVIAQIQEKRDQPGVEFLQDVGRILSSCEAAKAPIPEPVSPELQKSIQSLTWRSQQVVDMVDKFRENLESEIDSGIRERVRLDPETANPRLILSRDCKRVWVGPGKQNLPDTPKRFTGSLCVLGTQGFTSGRHYWEVEVGEDGWWSLGVALESVPRKKLLNLPRSEKLWGLLMDWDGQYSSICMTSEVLALRENLQRIRVCLDYEMGRVTFYNAKDLTQILLLEATFTEKVFPYFWICSQETHIQVCD